jgi:hypothetical protein
MRFGAFVIISMFLSLPLSAQNRDTNLKRLYDGHHWFALRDEISSPDTPLFYKAAVQTAFNDPVAEKSLATVISSNGGAEERFEARELLIGIYFRTGRYREAWEEGHEMLKERPDAADIKNLMPTLGVLKTYPDQAVTRPHPHEVRIDFEDGNIVLPLQINGIKANYIFDNGFSTSGMSEGEARRLGLQVREVATTIDTMNGTEVMIRIAVARNLEVAGIRLSNVAFYVLPDQQPPFNSLPRGRQGILGLPVILAMAGFSWNPQRHMFKIQGDHPRGTEPVNMAFDGTSIYTQVRFQGQAVNFSLDTGAQKTVLYPGFDKVFPTVRSSATSETHTLTGVGGSSEVGSLFLSSLTFNVGQKDVVLRPVHLLLKNNNSTSSWFVGNLGMDLLNQSRMVKVDFNRMSLTLR